MHNDDTILMQIPSPCYVLEEERLRRNLQLIRSVKEAAGVNIILAFKAYALWKSFPIIREYIPCSTASSIHEARLAFEEMGSPAHTYSPAHTERDFPAILRYSSHITFNSISQFERFYPQVVADGNRVSCGLRINPEYSEVETDLYNPCAPGSRLGITADKLATLPQGVEGLHFHTLCESTSYDLEKTLARVEERFGHLLPQVKWLNMGGGHLMTRQGYDTDHLVRLLRNFKRRHPNLELILEPGSAFGWQTGPLISTVVDIVENHQIRTAILDVSFACHMPDCLEMPYQPAIRGAVTTPAPGLHAYRMGGNSCLSGDYMGDWYFDHELAVGERIIFEDMIHYTTVKTTMFNGIPHPSIACLRSNGTVEMWREFDYNDYKTRMD